MFGFRRFRPLLCSLQRYVRIGESGRLESRVLLLGSSWRDERSPLRVCRTIGARLGLYVREACEAPPGDIQFLLSLCAYCLLLFAFSSSKPNVLDGGVLLAVSA